MSRFTNPVPQFWLDNGDVASSGLIEFYENKNYSSLKDTFADPDMSIKNLNPVRLDGQGRMPPCFGEGLCSVKFYAYDNSAIDKKGALQWSRDDVDLSGGGAGAFDEWSSVQTYGIGTIVKDSGNYYELYGANTSKGERPSTTPSKWAKIVFITEHIVGRSYDEDEIVSKDGRLYSSTTDGNITTPPSASWDNLTFNDSVPGDFNVGNNLIVGGAIDIAGGGDFDGTVSALQPAQSSNDETLVSSSWVKTYWPKSSSSTPITLVGGMTGSASYVLYGSICMVNISISNNAVTGNPLLNLPVGARPLSTMRGSCVFIDSGSVSYAKSLTIDSAGTVNFSPNPVTANGSFSGMIIFPII